MCIIVYNRDGKALDKKAMQVAFENNPHGYGIMWYDEGRVKTLRRHGNTFEQLWKTLEKFEGVSYALHLRWRTRGADGLQQCHPHRVTNKEKGDAEDIFLMHNGTLGQFVSHASLSDTKMFARKMRLLMASGEKGFNRALAEMNRHIEASFVNRLLFMDSTGEVTFVNEDAGVWEDGVWYSNTYSFEKGFRDPAPLSDQEKRLRDDPYRFDAKPRSKKTYGQQGKFWNDPAPTEVYRGTGTIGVDAPLFKASQKKKPYKHKRKNKNKNKKNKPGAWKAEEKRMPGHYIDSKGNRTYVTETGAVIRRR